MQANLITYNYDKPGFNAWAAVMTAGFEIAVACREDRVTLDWYCNRYGNSRHRLLPASCPLQYQGCFLDSPKAATSTYFPGRDENCDNSFRDRMVVVIILS